MTKRIPGEAMATQELPNTTEAVKKALTLVGLHPVEVWAGAAIAADRKALAEAGYEIISIAELKQALGDALYAAMSPYAMNNGASPSVVYPRVYELRD